MLASGQTLIRKSDRKIARLATNDDGPWAWEIGKDTAFIGEDGEKFSDDIKNWTHIEDEFGRPVYGVRPEGALLCPKSAKYARMTADELKKLREERLEEGFQKTIKEMEFGRDKLDKPGDYVGCAFCDGSKNFLLKDYFLKKVGATPLFEIQNPGHKVAHLNIFTFKNGSDDWIFHDWNLYRVNLPSHNSNEIET